VNSGEDELIVSNCPILAAHRYVTCIRPKKKIHSWLVNERIKLAIEVVNRCEECVLREDILGGHPEDVFCVHQVVL
jgi:hypothetical protein